MEYTPFGTAAIITVLSLGSLFGLYRVYNFCRSTSLKKKAKKLSRERRAEVYHYARLDKEERERIKAEEARKTVEMLTLEAQPPENSSKSTSDDLYRV